MLTFIILLSHELFMIIIMANSFNMQKGVKKSFLGKHHKYFAVVYRTYIFLNEFGG